MRKNKCRDFMEAKIKLDAGASYGKLDDVEGILGNHSWSAVKVNEGEDRQKGNKEI